MSTLARHVIAQVVLPRTSGLPEDVVTNTFHFLRDPDFTYAEFVSDMGTALADFYNGLTSPATTFPVANFINSTISRSTLCKVNFYDGSVLPGARTPTTTTFTLGTAASSNALPDEVALCLSFKANVTTKPFASQRGRVYIGPLNFDAVSGVSAGDSRPDTTFQSRLLDAAERLANAAKADESFWGVFSPTTNTIDRVELAWVDNAFDTQRRRGAAPSTRVTRAIEYP